MKIKLLLIKIWWEKKNEPCTIFKSKEYDWFKSSNHFMLGYDRPTETPDTLLEGPVAHLNALYKYIHSIKSLGSVRFYWLILLNTFIQQRHI